jgi:hypothetical protein
MARLYLNRDQIVKQEQYQDLLRQAEHYRLIKAAAKLEPKSPRQVNGAPGEALANLIRQLPKIWPISRART